MTGDEPVGSPKTKGWDAVGAKALTLSVAVLEKPDGEAGLERVYR